MDKSRERIMASQPYFQDTHLGLKTSALVGYIANNRFICVSVICGKASFPDQRIDLQLLSAGRRRVSFSALKSLKIKQLATRKSLVAFFFMVVKTLDGLKR